MRKVLNPFYLYSLIWTIVIIIYNLNWSGIYPPLKANIYIFFTVTIIFSLIIGFKFRKKYKILQLNTENKKIIMPILFIVMGHVCQFLYVGKIPLVEQLKKTGYMYTDFGGIPTFHVLLLTFNAYYSVYLSFLFFSMKKKKYLIGNIICVFMIALLYNRGMIIMVLFMSFLIFVSIKKLSKKIILFSFLFGTLTLYGFGILGNIRHGYKWNDTSYLGQIGKITNDLGNLNPFFWSYIYISSPLANLQYNIDKVEPQYGLKKLIAINLIPDFIAKRINIQKSEGILIVENLNVSSGFLSQFLEGGIIGMYLLFFVYSIFNLGYTFLLNDKSCYYPVGLAILCSIVTFSFFVNMYTFSGLSFQLIYPLIMGIIIKFKIKKN